MYKHEKIIRELGIINKELKEKNQKIELIVIGAEHQRNKFLLITPLFEKENVNNHLLEYAFNTWDECYCFTVGFRFGFRSGKEVK